MSDSYLTVIVLAGDPGQGRLPEWLSKLPANQSNAMLFVSDRVVGVEPAAAEKPVQLESTTATVARSRLWCRTLAEAIDRVQTRWAVISDAGVHDPAAVVSRFACWIAEGDDPSVAVAFDAAEGGRTSLASRVVPADRIDRLPQRAPRCISLAALRDAGVRADPQLRSELAADLITWQLLMRPGSSLALIGDGDQPGEWEHGDVAAEPAPNWWRNADAYDSVITRAFVSPLAEAEAAHGAAPPWLQAAVVEHLHWYFTVDGREHAPTVTCNNVLASAFHDRMAEVMRHIEPQALRVLPPQAASTEVRHALWSYRRPVFRSSVSADAYDHDQGLLRLSWWVHGPSSGEAFSVNGRAAVPRHAKIRGCRYFGRLLLRQRIVWLPVPSSGTLAVQIGGEAAQAGIGAQPFETVGAGSAADGGARSAEVDLANLRAAFPRGRGGPCRRLRGPTPWRVWLLNSLAGLPWIRRRYRDAWVFIDRDRNADDNAEHLYRWVRVNHPAVNCWFLLEPGTPDWLRLRHEGFRLVGPGLRRKLLLLNSQHIVSSHAEYMSGGLDARLYGGAMLWKYTFLQHGVIHNDLSHWLGPREFDRFITSSPQETQAIVGDESPYPYTSREVRCTGMPRHDRLLQLSDAVPPGERVLLLMPTWRASLVDERAAAHTDRERLERFAASDYARSWRALLNHTGLAATGTRIVFMPHANAAPYMPAFSVPPHVEVANSVAGGYQELMARAAAMVTDYSSVAFDMALLRRPVFYYQFDREAFFSGGHNWRPGYFDYERDGFGPVATTADALAAHVAHFFNNGGQTPPSYLARMERTLPRREGSACARVFDSILELDRPAR